MYLCEVFYELSHDIVLGGVGTPVLEQPYQIAKNYQPNLIQEVRI